MLVPRIITALVLVLAVVWGIYFVPFEVFALGALVVMLLGLYEWSNLCQGNKSGQLFSFLKLGLIFLLLIGVFIYLNPFNPAYFLLIAALFWLYKFVTLGQPVAVSPLRCQAEAVAALFLAWVALVMLKTYSSDSGSLLMLALLIVWSADTFAYFGGKKFGKNKLAPSISPGKTREGALAGALGAVLVAVIYAAIFIEQISSFKSYMALVIITVLAVLASVVGDLTESKLKRAAAAKDSGKLLPGHGGVLDRIDGLIASVPVFAFCWWSLTQLGYI